MMGKNRWQKPKPSLASDTAELPVDEVSQGSGGKQNQTGSVNGSSATTVKNHQVFVFSHEHLLHVPGLVLSPAWPTGAAIVTKKRRGNTLSSEPVFI